MSPLTHEPVPVTIVGGGLSGCEAALRLAGWGHRVRLYEMRPGTQTGAHKTSRLGELVCSNSLKSLGRETPHGLLKEELLASGSPVLEIALKCRIPGGGALVVDRERFAHRLTEAVSNHPNVRVVRERVTRIPPDRPLVIATGPLTHPSLVADLTRYLGKGRLSFYDAIAPIVDGDSVDWDVLFRQDRYGPQGEGDHWNAPMDRSTYERFCEDLLWGARVPPHEGIETDPAALRAFSACQPIESLVESGIETLAFGPLKPVGLVDPRSNRMPHAVVQLRPENEDGTAWNLIGFQTRLRYPEQDRIFRSIPGLSRARFLRYGSLHRNTFLDAPSLLKPDLTLAGLPGVYPTGQLVGVEGYTESVAMGFLTALTIDRAWRSDHPWSFAAETVLPPRTTAIGALLSGLFPKNGGAFCPVNLHFGLFPSSAGDPRSRRQRRDGLARRACRDFRSWERAVLGEDLKERFLGG